jgi:hypothetical protein
MNTNIKALSQTEFGTYVFEHRGMAIHNPMMSECGRFVYDEANGEGGFTPAEYGFEIAGTAGDRSRTAWKAFFALEESPQRVVYMVVTDVDGATHAVAPGAPVLISVCDSVGGHELARWLQEPGTLDEAPPRWLKGKGRPGETGECDGTQGTKSDVE